MSNTGSPLNVPPETPPTPPVERGGKIECEFCKCKLTRGGEVLQFSDEAKKYRELKLENERLEGTIDTLRSEKEAAEQKLRESLPRPEAQRPKGFKYPGQK